MRVSNSMNVMTAFRRVDGNNAPSETSDGRPCVSVQEQER